MALCLCFKLLGCATSFGDAVPNREVAIRIAMKKCLRDKLIGQYERWRAAIHGGVWHVWLSLEPGTQEEPRVGYYDIRIRASDGATGGCILQVGQRMDLERRRHILLKNQA